MKRSPGLLLVMPAYNEDANVGDAVRPCAAAGARFAATASARATVATDRVFISDLFQVDATASAGR